MGGQPVAVVQYTFTNKQNIEQHIRQKHCIEQHSSLIRKSADRAPSLRGIPLVFALQLGKKHGKTSVRVAGECQLAHENRIYRTEHKNIQNRAW